MSAPGIESKRIFAENLNYYIKNSGKSPTEIANILGVPVGTFFDWLKAKTYPRVNKIELLTEYFGITKSDLLEEHSERRTFNKLSDSREIFANNLCTLLETCRKSRQEVCDAIGVSYFTFSDWCNGKKYPRIEKLESLAKYFGISVPELIGSQKQECLRNELPQPGKDEVLDIVLRLHADIEFLKVVEKIRVLDSAKLKALQQFLIAFSE